MAQISLFDGNNKFEIDKPIRLIELFGGYGSQAFALKYLGANFEHWKLCEWAVKSIQAYKDAHFPNDNTDYSKYWTDEHIVDCLNKWQISSNYNEPMTLEQIKRLGSEKQRVIFNNICATHNLVNIQQVKGRDLQIVDTDKYCYVMTYSFPCQDLSSAGLGKGMEKGSGTRSGLLWEVERILDELNGGGYSLPQVLLMENVPEVIGTNNVKHFASWLAKLESLGYHCYWQVLNAKDYGVPQNRERCFMVSVLGDYWYEFPQKQKLEIKLKDVLEDEVDEKFYLSDKMLNFFVENSKNNEEKGNGFRFKPIDKENAEVGKTITTRNGSRMDDNFIAEPIACELRCDEGIRTFEDNVMGTLRTIDACGGKHIIEPQVIGGIGEKKSNNGTQWYQQDRIYDDNVAISITTGFNPYYTIKTKNKRIKELVNKMDLTQDNQFMDIYNQTTSENAGTITTRVDASNSTAVYTDYRIRKLTPKECFRLMGVKDQDFENIAQNQSNASLYHLAGDSIVVDVLMGIFRNMLKNSCNN